MTVRTRAAQRRERTWWTPPWLPPPLRELDGAGPSPPAVRETVGLLDLDLALLGGATRVVRQFHRTPLYVLRPIYLDASRGGMAFLYLQQHGDGLVQGDRYRIDLCAAPGAEVHLTTQAATKIYGMPDGYATQQVNIDASAGSVVEYLPDPVIPFRGARFFGATTVTAHPESTVLLTEILLPGRVARGERHEYDLCWTTTRARRPDGTPLLSDTLAFGRLLGRADSPARLGPYAVQAVLFALTQASRARPLCDRLRAALAAEGEVLAGVSLLPSDCGVGVRILGPTSATVQAAVRVAWDAARRELLGAPAPDLRKG